METKRSKYDTNPLDPDFVRKTEEVWSEGEGSSDTQEVGGQTREVAPSNHENPRSNIYSEAPTRRYDSVPLDAPYPSIFVPPTYSQPAPYEPAVTPYQAQNQKPTSRSVAGLGLPEKWATMLPYVPFYIGVVPAILWLILVPRKELRVRFHAAQGIALHIAILLLSTVFGVVGTLTGSSIGGTLFRLAAFIFLIISMVRVWKGKPHHIAPLAEPAQWFNEHIEPRNKL